MGMGQDDVEEEMELAWDAIGRDLVGTMFAQSAIQVLGGRLTPSFRQRKQQEARFIAQKYLQRNEDGAARVVDRDR